METGKFHINDIYHLATGLKPWVWYNLSAGKVRCCSKVWDDVDRRSKLWKGGVSIHKNKNNDFVQILNHLTCLAYWISSHKAYREQRWPSGNALGLRSKRSGVRFPASPLEFSEIGYLLLSSRDMAEILLKRRKSSIQPTTQTTTTHISNVTFSNK